MNRIPVIIVMIIALAAFSWRSPWKIIFFGDSITLEGDHPGGYVDILRNSLRRDENDTSTVVLGAGIGGNKVPDLLARLENDVLSQSPALVVIYIGINDVWHFTMETGGTPKEQYETGLRDLIARISAAGARTLLCTPSVIGEKVGGGNPQDIMLDQYAEISRTVAASAGVPVCDLRKAFLEYLATHNPENMESGILTRDGVHLNEKGNRFVADQLKVAIGEILH
jgi:lysophospholipase L1-like esterase